MLDSQLNSKNGDKRQIGVCPSSPYLHLANIKRY